jgi:hypothetical protein
MNTLYGELENIKVVEYLDRLIGRVFKIIPMNEEDCDTLDVYVDSLAREVFGNSSIFLGDELLTIVGTLKGLNFKNHKELKRDIFKTIDLITKAKERVK